MVYVVLWWWHLLTVFLPFLYNYQLKRYAELELRILTKSIPHKVSVNPNDLNGSHHTTSTKHLLYKHGDDLRQELLALQFIDQVHQILKCNGLNLRLKTFGCSPVSSKRGFIEWIYGCVPLSKICDPTVYSQQNEGHFEMPTSAGTDTYCDQLNTCDHKTLGTSAKRISMVSTVSVSSYSTNQSIEIDGRCESTSCSRSSLRYQKNGSKKWIKHHFMPRPTYYTTPRTGRTANKLNPIQEFLRSAAYDSHAPYCIRKDVMDTYVRSCAGYLVSTYLLVSFMHFIFKQNTSI